LTWQSCTYCATNKQRWVEGRTYYSVNLLLPQAILSLNEPLIKVQERFYLGIHRFEEPVSKTTLKDCLKKLFRVIILFFNSWMVYLWRCSNCYWPIVLSIKIIRQRFRNTSHRFPTLFSDRYWISKTLKGKLTFIIT